MEETLELQSAEHISFVPPPEPPRITGNSNPHLIGEGAVLTCRSEGGSPLPRLSWYNGTVQHNQSDTKLSGNGVEVNFLVPLLTKWHNGANLSCRADQRFPGTVQPQVAWTILDVQSVSVILRHGKILPKAEKCCGIDIYADKRVCTSGARMWLQRYQDQLVQEERKSRETLCSFY
ncbi:cell-cell adhesion [Branchiostoma belcheri]|nr:cell-cell adhesion [Branchiostoma belcheri]